VAFRGLAIPDCDHFSTPLGRVPLWRGCRDLAPVEPFVLDSRPHAREHAIEVQLPFLQRVLGEFDLIPIVFGAGALATDWPPEVEALSQLATPETLFVVSTDLSHDRLYDDACRVDELTIDQMLARSPNGVASADACGRTPAAALMHLATRQQWNVRLLDYCNSGDIAGRDSRIVGYAALAVTQ
jgi:AmmeMemoRadiSam system protein B